MAGDNAAVLDPDNTLAEPEPTPDLDLSEPEDALGGLEPDNGDEAAPEPDEPETLSREEAERLAEERVAAREKELAEAREAENRAAIEKWQQQQYEAARSQAVQARQGAVAKSVQQLVQWAHEQGDKGNELKFNPQAIDVIARGVEEMTFLAEWEAINTTGSALLAKHFPNWKPAEPVARAMQQAVYSRDPARMVDGWFQYMTAAAKDSVRDEVRAEVEAELADKQKTDALKAPEAKRQQRSGPTPVAGRGAPPGRRTFRTQQEVDMALFKNEIDSHTAREWLNKGLPYM